MIVRVIRFRSSLIVIGMTGWMLRTPCGRWYGPTPKFELERYADQVGNGVLCFLGKLLG